MTIIKVDNDYKNILCRVNAFKEYYVSSWQVVKSIAAFKESQKKMQYNISPDINVRDFVASDNGKISNSSRLFIWSNYDHKGKQIQFSYARYPNAEINGLNNYVNAYNTEHSEDLEQLPDFMESLLYISKQTTLVGFNKEVKRILVMVVTNYLVDRFTKHIPNDLGYYIDINKVVANPKTIFGMIDEWWSNSKYGKQSIYDFANRFARIDEHKALIFYHNNMSRFLEEMSKYMDDLTLVGGNSIKFGKGFYTLDLSNKFDTITYYLDSLFKNIKNVDCSAQCIIDKVIDNHMLNYNFYNDHSDNAMNIFKNNNILHKFRAYKNGAIKITFNTSEEAQKAYAALYSVKEKRKSVSIL